MILGNPAVLYYLLDFYKGSKVISVFSSHICCTGKSASPLSTSTIPTSLLELCSAHFQNPTPTSPSALN